MVTPKEVTVNQITNEIQGQLIKVKNVKFTSIDNAGASMAEDSTGSINVYKMPVVAGLVVGDIADITAAVTCYGTTIELAVDSAADVVKAGTIIPLNGVTLDKAYLSIRPKMSETLMVTLLPDNATNQKVIWESSNDLVASVDENGKVTGHKIGLAKISVTTEDGNYKAECTVAVSNKPVTKVKINKKSITIKVGKNEKLTALVGPGNADIKDVIWTCNSSIIKINQKKGKLISVIGISTGTAKVTVTSLDGGYTATCKVVVINKKK